MENTHVIQAARSAAASPVHHPSVLSARCSPLQHRSSTKQNRLLESRNARFVAKDIPGPATDVIVLEENRASASASSRPLEFEPGVQYDDYVDEDVVVNASSDEPASGQVLQDIANTRSLPSSQRGRIPSDLDETCAVGSPALHSLTPSKTNIYQDIFDETETSSAPIRPYEQPSRMRLRQLSGNEHRPGPFASSPDENSFRMLKQHKPVPAKFTFDMQDYVEHIERELQQAREALYSPTSKKSLKDQLRTFRLENERLKQQVAQMRDTFDAEAKSTIERKTAIEADLKREIKDLKDTVKHKEDKILHLECEHEEKRLDSNTIDALKSAIERLEQEKALLEEAHTSMSKRNEVLSELLAMSPTKAQNVPELRSPIREKRSGRPMSMILPRLISSPPLKATSQPNSALNSPQIEKPSPLQLTASENYHSSTLKDTMSSEWDSSGATELDVSLCGLVPASQSQERRSTSASERPSRSSSPNQLAMPADRCLQEEVPARFIPKRKPRRFMQGSTQLKPLLLPALTGEALCLPVTSAGLSPQSTTSRDSALDLIDTESVSEHARPRSDPFEHGVQCHRPSTRSSNEGDETVRYQTFEEVLALDEYETKFGESVPRDSTAQNLRCHDNTSPAQPVREINSGLDRMSDFYSADQYESLSDNLRGLSSIDNGLSPGTFLPSSPALVQDIPAPLFSPLRQRSLQAKASVDNAMSKSRQFNFLLECRKRRRSIGDWPQTSASAGRIPSPFYSSSLRNTTIDNFSPSSTSQISPAKSQSLSPSISSTSKLFSKVKSPLGMLSSELKARSIPATTVRAIFGAVSCCTTYMRDFRQNPFALARRVIANAWYANWSRLGKLSWWVLGLFISPVHRSTHFGVDWEHYDAEGIARRVHESHVKMQQTSQVQQKVAVELAGCAVDNESEGEATVDSMNGSKPPEEAEVKAGWCKSLFLWGKFSVAIMLAVGGAVVKGPAEMLKDIEQRQTSSLPQGQQPVVETNNEHLAHDLIDLSVSDQRGRKTCRQRLGGDRFEMTSPISSPALSSAGSCWAVPQLDRTFSFRTGQQLVINFDSEKWQPDDQHRTIRPIKSRRPYSEDLYLRDARNQAEFAFENSSMACRSSSPAAPSEAVTLDSDILKWPPSPDIVPHDRFF